MTRLENSYIGGGTFGCGGTYTEKKRIWLDDEQEVADFIKENSIISLENTGKIVLNNTIIWIAEDRYGNEYECGILQDVQVEEL